jgi:alpha-tubulin suppressor-like RCC1 family protein
MDRGAMVRNVYVVLAILAAGLLGCGGGAAEPPIGQEKGHCYSNGTCNQGLSCFSNRCVRYRAVGGGDGGAPNGSAGGAGGVQGGAGQGPGGAGASGAAGASGGAGASDGKAGTTGGLSGAGGAGGRGGAGGAAGRDGGLGDAPSSSDSSMPDVAAGVDMGMEAPVTCPTVPTVPLQVPSPPAGGGPGAVWSVATGVGTSCASSQSGQLKCWGWNYSGKLGLGDSMDRGDQPNEMGANLPFINLGTGILVAMVGVATGAGHVCALFDNARVKCWGDNQLSQLGLGDMVNRGEIAAQMGDNLPFVDLGGPGPIVGSISVGAFWTCAIVSHAQIKCWGSNRYGELGLGDTTPRGSDPGLMGDHLPTVELGTCRTVKAVSAGQWGHTCAILDDGHVKCWGINQEGELGLGDVSNRGNMPGQMGDALPEVRLGTGRTAVAISAGFRHTCALLDDKKVKCWGDNSLGQLGVGDNNTRGRQPSDMGDNLPEVDLGNGRTVVAISVGQFSSCAILNMGEVKCWGQFFGLGEYPSMRGTAKSQMGDALPAIDLGTGRTAKGLAATGTATCALLDNGQVKCWGTNAQGGLGLGDTMSRGNQPGQMGDSLPAVSLW